MEAKSEVIPISSPWRATLLTAIKSTRQSLFLICPYIKEEVITAIRETLRQSREREQAQPLTVRVLTRVLAEDLFNGSSDISALFQLLHWPEQLTATSVELKAINNLHAKVWIFDDTLAIVSSGNVTPSGLDANLEYGLAISDPQLLAQIQQEWAGWWQQAETVEEEQLAQMQLWLERERTALQPLLAQVEEQRKTIERHLGTSPRIGKRLSLVSTGKQAKRSRVGEGSIPYSSTSNQQGALTLSTSHLRQVLRWVVPAFDGRLLASPETYMKLACIAVSADEAMLRCVWADGKRFSQATGTGRASAAQLSWTLTLDMQQINVLQQLLNTQVANTSGQDEITLYFSEAGGAGHLRILRRFPANIIGEINISGALSSPPPSFPRLRPPLSKIIIDPHIFMEIPQSVEQQMLPLPALIQMSLEDREGGVCLRFTTGMPDDRIEIRLSNVGAMLAGPSVRLSLDYQAFHHVITTVPEQIDRWRISLDRDAVGMQFIPEASASIWQSWRHYLWHREH